MKELYLKGKNYDFIDALLDYKDGKCSMNVLAFLWQNTHKGDKGDLRQMFKYFSSNE